MSSISSRQEEDDQFSHPSGIEKKIDFTLYSI